MGIGNRITDWAEERATAWGGRLLDWTARTTAKGLSNFTENLEIDAKDDTMEIIAKLRDHPQSAGLPRNLLSKIETNPHGWQVILLVVAGVFMIVPMVFSLSRPLANIVEYEQHRVFEDARFDPQSAANVAYRDPAAAHLAWTDLEDMGWNDKRIGLFMKIFRPLLAPDEVRQLTLRFPERADEWREYLFKAGFTPDEVEDLRKLYPIVPPLADMVRFADFGSFDPEIIAAWREFYDAPGFISEPFKLLGVINEGDRDWANKYWFSHWRQPGRFELGEMHRRGLLGGRPAGSTRPETASERADADEIVRKAYLTQGYSSFWQSRLLDLVGENLTRVDIRRMHKLGILDDEQLSDAYHRIGYYKARNDHMVEFTKAYNATDDRDLTATEIVKAYKRGTIERDEAIDLLQEIGYSEDSADFKLQVEDAGTAETERTLSEAKLKILYLAGLEDKTLITADLADKGYDAREIEHIYKIWDLEAVPGTRLPTRSELSHFLAEGILTEPEFISWMDRIGYPPVHIDWYLEEYTADQAAAARKEEEAALDEAERIARATVKSDYQVARAGLDVRIAEVRVFIADARRSLLDIGTDAERVALRDLAAREREVLARLALDQRQEIAGLSIDLRIAARGVTDEEKAALELATLAERQSIELMTIGERESVSSMALAEAEAVRADVSDLRAELREDIADATAQIARLTRDKAELKLSYGG